MRIMNGESVADSIYSVRHFRQHGRRERAPPFAKFHGVVHLGVHLWIARIGKDRAAAERARPELHASLKPAEDFSVRQHFRGGGGGVAHASGAQLVCSTALSQFPRPSFPGRDRRGAFASSASSAAVVNVRSERGAEANAVVACRGLNKNTVHDSRSGEFFRWLWN